MADNAVIVTGATGQVGTYISLFLARLGVADFIYLVCRDPRRASTVLFNTKTNALMRGHDCKVEALPLDLRDYEAAAEQLEKIKPRLIINSAALMTLYPYFPALRRRQKRMGFTPGFAHTLPKDMAVLWPLMRAVHDASPDTRVVNLAAPDTGPFILKPLGLVPTVGAGTLDSTTHGIRLAVGNKLGVPYSAIRIQMVSHHAIRRFPSSVVPFFLRIYANGEDVTRSLDHNELIDHAVDVTGVETVSTPVDNNASITAASAVETARAILLDTGEIRHGSGVDGAPGGTPVRLTAAGAQVVLPEGLTPDEARRINEVGMHIDGLESVDENGTVTFTENERRWIREGLGLSWDRMSLEDSYDMYLELDEAYKRLNREETA
ncbi:MAG: hypothetical protein NUW23_10190 [Firmicutes bacterium]|nr:hypothetical protein [Bacillota bacterium]